MRSIHSNNSRPTTGDFELAQRVFAYLLETADLGINFYAQVDNQEEDDKG